MPGFADNTPTAGTPAPVCTPETKQAANPSRYDVLCIIDRVSQAPAPSALAAQVAPSGSTARLMYSCSPVSPTHQPADQLPQHPTHEQHTAGDTAPLMVVSQSHGRSVPPTPRLILSLCDYSGNWCAPYRRPGYEVIQVDTKLGLDVLTYVPPRQPWGVLAAPPCTLFTAAGAHTWAKTPPAELLAAIDIAEACLHLCRSAQAWWCLENPRGRLGRYIGPHAFEFQPWWYGDPWTKRTCLWGHFNVPQRTPVIPQYKLVGAHRRLEPTAGLWGRVQLPEKVLCKMPAKFSTAGAEYRLARQTARSNTPPGFATAFARANP